MLVHLPRIPLHLRLLRVRLNTDRGLLKDDVSGPELSVNSPIDSISLRADEDARMVGDGSVGEQDFAKLMAAAAIASR